MQCLQTIQSARFLRDYLLETGGEFSELSSELTSLEIAAGQIIDSEISRRAYSEEKAAAEKAALMAEIFTAADPRMRHLSDDDANRFKRFQAQRKFQVDAKYPAQLTQAINECVAEVTQ